MGCGDQKPQPVALVNEKSITARGFAAVLPRQIDSSVGEEETKHRVLNDIIIKELFIQEAERQGLNREITYQLELEEKGLVTQELYDAVVAQGNRPATALELEAARRLLKNEDHIKMIEVETEKLARGIALELDKGVPFDTLAKRHSVHRSAKAGGDLGFVPELAIEEPMRSAVLALEPGARTGPIPVGRHYQIVQLVDRRPADPGPPPLGEIKQELQFRLKQQERRRLANRYLADLRGRLVFNPEGLDVMCKPVDSITEQEKDVCVAVKDQSKYVKVGRLLHVARRFPASLDTAMRKYAVRREIEEDLIFEDGLDKELDKLPRIQERLAQKRRDLLYETLFKQEITDKVAVSEQEIQEYFEQNRGNYPTSDLKTVASLIRRRVSARKRDERLEEYKAGLWAKASISIDTAAVLNVPLKQNSSRK